MKLTNTSFIIGLTMIGLLTMNTSQAALSITNVSVTAPTTTSSGMIHVTGYCNVGNGPTSLEIKLQGSGPSWSSLGSGNGNCNNAGQKTKSVPYTNGPGNYKIRVLQGGSSYVWPAIVVLP